MILRIQTIFLIFPGVYIFQKWKWKKWPWGKQMKKKEEKRRGKKGKKRKRGKEEKKKKRKGGKKEERGKICPKKFLFKLNKGEKIWNLPFFSPSSLGNGQGGRRGGIGENKGEKFGICHFFPIKPLK